MGAWIMWTYVLAANFTGLNEYRVETNVKLPVISGNGNKGQAFN
jgi:hypothetical protein